MEYKEQTVGQTMDSAAVYVCATLTAEAWRYDASRYTGTRREMRVRKAEKFERIAKEAEARG